MGSRDPTLLLNSHALPGYVSPNHGHGIFTLHHSTQAASDHTTTTHVWWQVADVCLENEPDGSCSPEHSGKTVIFELYQFGKLTHPGFTITYKHSTTPELIRFSPFYDWNAAFNPLELSDHWTLPSSLLSSISSGMRNDPQASPVFSVPASPFVTLVSLPTGSIVDPITETLLSSILSSTGDDGDLPQPSPVFSVPVSSFEALMSLPTGNIANPTSETLLPGLVPTATAIVTAFAPAPTHDRVSDQIPSQASVPSAQNVEGESPPLCSIGIALHAVQSRLKDLVAISRSKYRSFRPNVAGLQQSLGSMQNPHDSISTEVQGPIGDGSLDISEPSITSLISSNRLIEAALPSPTPFHYQKSRHDHVIRALKITTFSFIIVCIAALVFSHLVSSPRRRADRAARREECRNRRLYQHAAHKYMWRRRWEALLRKFGSRDPMTSTQPTWDDKLLPPLPTISSEENIREELQAMRNTYKVVDRIVQAEEGRTNITSGPLQKFVLRRWERRASRISRSSSDVTGPPPYEEFTDGYRYTPPESDTTPDSSVIDTSSRNDSDYEKD